MIDGAERINVIEEGKLCEEGTNEDLTSISEF
jgi:ABC-type multidrug transport system fused ATPase/permease subunit